MLIEIPNVTGELILTKDKCAYQEVLDGFKDAENVTIVSYNISKKKDNLLKALYELDANVRVITAIPGRLKWYNGDSPSAQNLKKSAADAIKLYLEKLSPEQFGPLASVSFCFDNHAKIIMTEKVAYVGSANFSEESKGNWEAGVIIRDPDAIKKLDVFIDEIEGDSIRYYGKEMLAKIAPLVAARKRLTELNDELAVDFERVKRNDVKDAIDQLREAIAGSDRAWSEAFEESGPVLSRIDGNTMWSVENWFEETVAVFELDQATERLEAAEGGDIDAGQLPVNNDGNIPDCAFNEVIEELLVERECKVSHAQKATVELQSYITELCQQIDAICRDVAGHIKGIDNTRPQ